MLKKIRIDDEGRCASFVGFAEFCRRNKGVDVERCR
jgi:hypothetical protein